jgi:hypothetical protein
MEIVCSYKGIFDSSEQITNNRFQNFVSQIKEKIQTERRFGGDP